MKHSTILTVTITFVVLFGAFPAFGRSAHDLFQQALVAERSAGDLQKAIDLYGEVVKQAGSDRALAVRALLQMGGAYEKLGKTEAKKAYEQIVREFGDQTTAVAAARERLARIDQPAVTERAAASEGLKSSLLWAEVGDASGEVSRNGQYFSYVSWDTGDIAVHDLQTGEVRLLTDSGDWTESNDFGGQSRFSADGGRLAYTWYDNEGIVDLRTVTIGGPSPPEILLREDSIAYVEPGRFSLDGKYLLVSITRKNGKNELATLELENRKLRILTTHDHHLHPIEFSPDGKLVVYSTAASDADQSDIVLISASGGEPVPVAPHSSREVGVGFSPSGDRVLFTSGRSGQRGLWEVPIRDGRPSGEPKLLRAELGDITPFGIARNGSLYYGVRTDFRDAYILDLDENGIPAGSAKRLGDFIGRDTLPVWSADGRKLLFVSHRGTGNPSRPNEPVYVLRRLPGGEETILSSSIRPPRRPVTIAWSPDEKRMAFYGTTDPDRTEGLFIVDAATGDATRLEVSRQTQPVWSSDSRTLYYTDKSGDHSTIQAYDVESETTKVFLRSGPAEEFGTLAISPDGEHLAFRKVEGDYSQLDVLQLVSLNGGAPKNLLREPVRRRGSNISNGAGLVFTPDGKYVLFGRWENWSTSNPNVELFRVPTSGGPSEPLGVRMNHIVGLSMNPNGGQIGFTSGGMSHGELWVLENFLGIPEKSVALR